MLATHRRPRSGALAIAVALAVVADAALADVESFFADLPIVASASRLPQRLSEAPAAVTVMDRELIRASGMRTVADLLRLVPGFQVTSANQSPAVVTYHGLSGGMVNEELTPRVQVLIDGRSQYSPLYKSGVEWNLLPVALEDIERIEVIRGPNTVAYGSNAFLGVINIITTDTSLTKGWLVSANQGNNGIEDEMLRWGGKAGDADLHLTMQRSADHGFQRAFYNKWTDPHDDRRSTQVALRADQRLSNNDELQLTLAHVANVSQFGRPDRPATDPFRDLQQDTSAFGAQWRRSFSANDELKLRYAYTQDWAAGPYVLDGSFPLNTNPPTAPKIPVTYVYDPGGKSTIHELEFERIQSPTEQTRLMFGGAAKMVAMVSPGQFSTNEWQHRNNYRVFGNLEYRPEMAWLFNLGASVEHDSLSGWMFDPRASASYHLNSEHTVRLGLSRAHRTPSFYEALGRVEVKNAGTSTPFNLTYFAQGVQPEVINSAEISYFGEFKALKASVDLRAFYERIPNRIQVVPLALPASNPDDADSTYERTLWYLNAAYPYGRADGAINLERVRTRGVEYQLRWQPLAGTRLLYNGALISIDAELTDSSTIADTVNPNIPKIAAQTKSSAPTHAESVMLIQQLPQEWQMSLMYFHNGTMRWRRNSDPIAPSYRVDWRLAKAFKLGTSQVEVAYTVQMANGAQEGRIGGLRYADRLQWLSLAVKY